MLDLESFGVAVAEYEAKTVWLNSSGVVAILDEAYRDDRIVLPLPSSDEWMALEDIPHAMSQKRTIMWLRRILSCFLVLLLGAFSLRKALNIQVLDLSRS